jgi:hypothetical protein
MRKEAGRSGVIVPTGIATDKGNSTFFRFVVENELLSSLADFVNGKIFKNIDSRMRFSLIIFGKTRETKMLFVLRNPEHLYTRNSCNFLPKTCFWSTLTGTAPVFSSQKDMDLVLKIYRNSRVLLREYEDGTTDNPYGIKVSTQFHMSNDSDKFVREQELIDQGYEKNWIYYEKDGERYVPLCEGKTFYILDSRYNHIADDGNGTVCTAEEKSDSRFFPRTRYFINENLLDLRLMQAASSDEIKKGWALVHRNVSNPTNERTFVVSITGKAAWGNSATVVFGTFKYLLLSVVTSHILDFVLKRKIQGNNINQFIVEQLPVPDPDKFKELPD